MGHDLVFACRQLRRSPAFALAAILTLALGIGANAAIYQVLDAVAFRSLPVDRPQQLVRLQLLDNGRPVHFSYPLYRELSARQQVAAGVLAASDYPLHAAVLRGRGESRTVNAVLVSGNYFPVLGVAAQWGRIFTEADDRPAAAPAAVISDRFWTREFARSPNAIGQTLEINKAVVTIVGVAPAGFYGEVQGNNPDMWLPMVVAPQAMATDWLNAPNAQWLTVIARLRPEVSPRQAQDALQSLYQQLDHSPRPAGRGAVRLALEPASRGVAELQQRFQSPLVVLMAVVGMVLLIACCNLANLLLGRATARTAEIGMRLALGAGRARLVRQLVVESLLLAVLGAIAAMALARWGAQALVTLAAGADTWGLTLHQGWRVPAFTTAITAVATCLFGLVPALAATRVDLIASLRGSGRGAIAGGARQFLGKALVVAQVSISLLLLSGSALLVRSLWSLQHQDFGFQGEHLLMAELPWEFNPAMMARYRAMMRPLYEQLNALPGVRAAALSGFGPMGGDQHTGPLSAPGHPSMPSDNTRLVHVSPRYFETMGIAMVEGRTLTDGDRAGAPGVAVLSETAARKLFGGAPATGRPVALSNIYDAASAVTVVGVAHDVRFANPGEPFGALVYLPLAQSPAPITAIVVRAAGEPEGVAANVRAVLHTVDPARAIGAVRPVRDTIAAKLGHERLLAFLASAFGLLALVMTSVGVYGVIAYAMERRTREIGIRLALGATAGQVAGGLMAEVWRMVAVGIFFGAVGSIAATQALRSMLFGFRSADYALLALVAAVLILAASLAAWLPARRASHMDPADALRW